MDKGTRKNPTTLFKALPNNDKVLHNTANIFFKNYLNRLKCNASSPSPFIALRSTCASVSALKPEYGLTVPCVVIFMAAIPCAN